MSHTTEITPDSFLNLHLKMTTPHLLSKPADWWKSAIVYQIWPHSFLDTHGTGHGDLGGILSKLDYLVSLGINTIWISPMYASPLVDMGYDISDYESVNPIYGTMAEMDELIAGCHKRGVRLLLDLVINHTSDQHRWFLESKQSQQGKYADYYIWKDPKVDKDGKRSEPNNWGSFFGGSAWEWVEERGQYYLHLFAKEQPDLNWELKEVREAIYDSAIRFWLDKGIDGFRVDTCLIYSKDQRYLDGPVDGALGKYGNMVQYVGWGPRIFEFWEEMRDEVFSKYGDVMIVGEGGGEVDKMMRVVGGGPGKRLMSMVFDFDLASVGETMNRPDKARRWKLTEIKKAVGKIQGLVMLREQDGWTSVFKENHDRPRSVSKYGSENSDLWEQSAKLIAMWMGSLSGTQFVYQGEEIGMTNIPYTWSIDDLRDLWALDYLKRFKEDHPNDKEAQEKAWRGVVNVGRDNSRTPVQWSSESNAGFTTGKPWIRVNDNYKKINVANQLKDKNSIWYFWQKVLKMRKEHKDIFVYGDYEVLDEESEQLYTYLKTSKDGRRAMVVLNFSDNEYDAVLPDPGGKGWDLLYSSVEEPGKTFKPWEGKIFLEKQ